MLVSNLSVTHVGVDAEYRLIGTDRSLIGHICRTRRFVITVTRAYDCAVKVVVME